MCWLVPTSKDLGGRPPLASRCISLSWLFFHGGNTNRPGIGYRTSPLGSDLGLLAPRSRVELRQISAGRFVQLGPILAPIRRKKTGRKSKLCPAESIALGDYLKRLRSTTSGGALTHYTRYTRLLIALQ